MKIVKIETFTNRLIGFVRVTIDSGEQGWGQVSTHDADISCEVLHRHVAPHALGSDALDLEKTIDLIGDRELKFPGTFLRRATGGLDTALWDLKGKVEGKPVTSLIGGSLGPLRAYGSSMRRDISPEDEAERLCRLRDEQGFDAFKWRVGMEAGRDIDKWPGRTEAIVPHVAKALEVRPCLLELAVDFHPRILGDPVEALLARGELTGPRRTNLQHKIADQPDTAKGTLTRPANATRRGRLEVTLTSLEALEEAGLRTLDNLARCSFRTMSRNMLGFRLPTCATTAEAIHEAMAQMQTRGVTV